MATEKICWDLTTTRFGVQTGVVTIAGSAALESCHRTRRLLVQHAYDATCAFGVTAATGPCICWYSMLMMLPVCLASQLPPDPAFVGPAAFVGTAGFYATSAFYIIAATGTAFVFTACS